MKPTLDFETQLHSVPIRNEKLKLSVSEHDPDVLIVEVELRYRGVVGLLAKLLKSRERKRYELAGLARELFDALDGKTCVEDLIDVLMAQDNMPFLEARGLMLQYLRDLMQRGLIVIVPDAAVS